MRRKKSIKKQTKRAHRQAKLTNKQMERARRLNDVFNLRMKGLKQDAIANKLGISKSNVGSDNAFLKKSVTSPKTLKKLGSTGPSQRVLDRRKRVIDLRANTDLSYREIGRRLGVSGAQVEQDVQAIVASNPNLRKKLLKPLSSSRQPVEKKAPTVAPSQIPVSSSGIKQKSNGPVKKSRTGRIRLKTDVMAVTKPNEIKSRTSQRSKTVITELTPKEIKQRTRASREFHRLLKERQIIENRLEELYLEADDLDRRGKITQHNTLISEKIRPLEKKLETLKKEQTGLRWLV